MLTKIRMGTPIAVAPEIKLCNCAGCGRELLGDSLREWYFRLEPWEQLTFPEPVFCRIKGRPYCSACVKGSSHHPKERPAPRPDPIDPPAPEAPL